MYVTIQMYIYTYIYICTHVFFIYLCITQAKQCSIDVLVMYAFIYHELLYEHLHEHLY